jgi:hypothetical protein
LKNDLDFNAVSSFSSLDFCASKKTSQNNKYNANPENLKEINKRKYMFILVAPNISANG